MAETMFTEKWYQVEQMLFALYDAECERESIARKMIEDAGAAGGPTEAEKFGRDLSELGQLMEAVEPGETVIDGRVFLPVCWEDVTWR